MAELAKLVEVLLEDKASDDFSNRLRSTEVKAGLEKFYVILNHGVDATGDGKPGFESWNNSQIQAVASIASAVASATRSLSRTISGPCMFLILVHEFSLFV